MCDAAHGLRRNIPRGMCSCQKDIGGPKIRANTPASRSAAAVARPYGPAPTTTTSHFEELMCDPPALGPAPRFPRAQHEVEDRECVDVAGHGERAPRALRPARQTHEW